MNRVFENMTFEVEDGVAIMTINRPEVHNVLDNAGSAIPPLPS